MHNDTHSAHDFTVKFIPSVWVAVVASLTWEMAAQSSVYHAHGTAVSGCYPWFVCHDKTNYSAECMLAEARPPIINHLTSLFHVLLFLVRRNGTINGGTWLQITANKCMGIVAFITYISFFICLWSHLSNQDALYMKLQADIFSQYFFARAYKLGIHSWV